MRLAAALAMGTTIAQANTSRSSVIASRNHVWWIARTSSIAVTPATTMCASVVSDVERAKAVTARPISVEDEVDVIGTAAVVCGHDALRVGAARAQRAVTFDDADLVSEVEEEAEVPATVDAGD